MNWLWLSLLLIQQAAYTQENPAAGSLFGRKYKPGDTYRYRLTTDQYNNGKWQFSTIVVCELHVVTDSAGVPYEEIHWLPKKKITARDTVDELKQALAVKPYRISLDYRGKIDIPPIKEPGMTGAITDFNTFFVAVSPLMGATLLKKKGDSLVKKDLVKGDFSNGKTILKGDDCLAVTIRMTGKTNKQVVLETAFLPPGNPCLDYISADMQNPVIKDTINNFQMVQPAGTDKYMVQYGVEQFTITSTVRRADGKILQAAMNNTLHLTVKVNCDKDYQNCQTKVPFLMQRNLKLELLK